MPDRLHHRRHLRDRGPRSVYGVALSARNPRGDFGSLPATGTSATSPITKIFRIADGQIGEAWVHLDTLSLYSQLGILPAPGGAYGPFNDNVVGPYLNPPISYFQPHVGITPSPGE